MKEVLFYVIAAVVLISIVFAFVYGLRLFFNATSPVVLHKPAPGISCATMVTFDGAAISCWKDYHEM